MALLKSESILNLPIYLLKIHSYEIDQRYINSGTCQHIHIMHYYKTVSVDIYVTFDQHLILSMTYFKFYSSESL